MEKQKGASLPTRPVSEIADRPQPRPGERGDTADHSRSDRQAKALVDPESVAAALVILASYNIPTDIQELLVRGNPAWNVRPGALAAALQAKETK